MGGVAAPVPSTVNYQNEDYSEKEDVGVGVDGEEAGVRIEANESSGEEEEIVRLDPHTGEALSSLYMRSVLV